MSNKINQAKAQHPAELYNRKRRIVFSTVNKDPALARTNLQGYRKDIGAKGYAGLDAELTFFERYRSDFQPVPRVLDSEGVSSISSRHKSQRKGATQPLIFSDSGH